MILMNRVAAKFAMDATATRYCETAVCGSSRLATIPAPKGYAPPCHGCRSEPRRIAVAYGRCARNSPGKDIFPASFSQGKRQRRRANLAQPLGALALRAAGCVARLAKGATATRYRVAAACGSSRQLAPPAPEGYAPPCWGCTIRCTSRLARHPAKPSARSCGSYSEVP